MSLAKEIWMWITVMVGIVVGIAMAAMAAGFLFGIFVKFAKFALLSSTQALSSSAFFSAASSTATASTQAQE